MGVTEFDECEWHSRDGEFLKMRVEPAASEVNDEQVDGGLGEKLRVK